MEKYFYLEESPIYKNKYIIRLNHDKFLFPTGTSGSYNVFIARVLNLSYADYLRYSRDRLGAELIGKQSRYVMAYYDKNGNLLTMNPGKTYIAVYPTSRKNLIK